MSTTIIYTILIALASYRIYHLIAHDTITEPLRAHLLNNTTRTADWTLTLITCAWCIGFWITGTLTLTWALTTGPTVYTTLLVWWSASTITGMLDHVT